MSNLHRTIRAIQSRFPFLTEAKAYGQKIVRASLKIPFEKDFEIFGKLQFDSNSTILDIGANRGQSIDAIRLYHKNAKIISFEPNELLANRLDKNYAHDKNLMVEHFGLGDVKIKTPLFTPFYYGYMYDGLSSFDFNEAHDWISDETIAWFNPKELQIRETICEVKILDELNLAPDFIKIDVQGFEKNVLIGGAKTIEKYRPLIMFEINDAAEEYMNSIGWQQYKYEDGLLHPSDDGLLNVFFIHPEAKGKFAHIVAD